MRSFLASALVASALVFASSPARADISSWLAFGGGAGVERNGVVAGSNGAGVFSASMGVGSSPRKPFVVGGIFRSTTYVGLGTDVGIAARFASGGFARGQWGGAFDLGVVARPWRDGDYGRYPLQGVFLLGAPWGFQAGLGVQAVNLGGSPTTFGGFAVLEIDILRLTVMRQGKTDLTWWNASPVGGHLDEPSR
ncbi:MAG: hypothetical protein ABI461_08515 [Polyangiaceae bacterium]